MPLNKQPIFTATPILECIEFDPQITTGLYSSNKATEIYDDKSTYGSLITKITVNSPAKVGDRATTKRIYLMISDVKTPTNYNIFDSKLMTGIASAAVVTDTPPSVVFEFPTGLVTTPTTVLGIASTTNEATSGFAGDRVTVIVEGGTYDQPA